MNWKKIGISVAAIAVVVGGVIWMTPNKEKKDEIIVSAKKIQKENVIETLTTTGLLIPEESQKLYGQDVVNEVLVHVGDTVEKDALLATYVNGLQLKSNIAGTVTSINIKEKEIDVNAQSGQPSITVDNLGALKIQVGLSKSEAVDVKKEQEVTITSGKATYKGKVDSMDPVATMTQTPTGKTASLGAVVTFNEVPENLFAGFDVDLDITTAIAEQVLSLPIESLNYDKNNQPYVYVVKNNVAKKMTVETGIQSDTNVEVKSGLQEGDAVILSPTPDVKNNVTVSIK